MWFIGKGGKNRRRGKNENESDKRELIFKEDGQGGCDVIYIYIYNLYVCVFILRCVCRVCSSVKDVG